MQFDAELLLLAMALIFLACIGWEAWHARRTRPEARMYNWRHTLCNTTLLGWLEYVPNTPSIHRVHHARNGRYIDRNYAGVLMIWDRLFGSYVDKDPHEATVYGIVEPLHTYNPLKATFHEWASMAQDLARVHGWHNRLNLLFAPPAWDTQYHASPQGAHGVDRVQRNDNAAV
jgi:hypothetical protein